MSSRTDLCGGCRATGIPTAIPGGELRSAWQQIKTTSARGGVWVLWTGVRRAEPTPTIRGPEPRRRGKDRVIVVPGNWVQEAWPAFSDQEAGPFFLGMIPLLPRSSKGSIPPATLL